MIQVSSMISTRSSRLRLSELLTRQSYYLIMVMHPLKIYDYLELARQQVFVWVRPLNTEEYSREFPIGLGSLGRTLTHVMICEWMYIQRMEEKVVPPYSEWPIQDENPPPFAELESLWNDQAVTTRATLAAVEDWDREVEQPRTLEDGRTYSVVTSLDEMFMQLAFHEVHHRAQVLNMLRQLGVETCDIDYNALMVRQKNASP
jgi:uncharacterized damage-inducible protein DinB